MANNDSVERAKRKWEELKKGGQNTATPSSSRVRTTTKTSDGVSRAKRKWAELSIGVDTLGDDLANVGSTLETIYGGWQSPETLKSARASFDDVFGRLGKAKEHGVELPFDVDSVLGAYDTVLSDWDKLESQYGYYKDADSYNKALKQSELAKKFKAGMTYDQVQEELKKYEQGTDEYEYLSNYTGYSSLDDFDKALSSLPKEEEKTFIEKVKDFDIKDHVTGGIVNNSVLGRMMGYGTPKTYEEQLRLLRNQYALDNASEPYMKHKDAEDFEELSQYVSSKGADDAWWQDTSDTTYEFINNVDGARDSIISAWDKNQVSTPIQSPHPLVERGLAYMNDDEKKIYNYIYRKEGKEKANEFLDTIEVMLTKRATDEQATLYEEAVDGDNPVEGALTSIAMSTLSIPMNIAGAPFSLIDSATGNPYGYWSQMSNASSAIRESVGENIEEDTSWQIGGQNVWRFLYDTGMSIGDSAVGAVSFGHGLSPIMGMSAYQQKAKEMKEAGEDDGVVFGTAIASGVAEALFEYVSVDKLLKIKNVDGWHKAITETVKQMGIEGSEEVFTEIANVISDNFLRGGNSEIAQMYDELKNRGFGDDEIATELAKYVGDKVTLAFVGGAISGGVMGGVQSARQYKGLKASGAEIRSNDRASDMMTLAGLTPEESEAYKAYTEYAGKGMTTDTISDARLGNLQALMASDAYETAKSKKTTDDQKLGAYVRMAELDRISAPKTAEEKAEEQKKKTDRENIEQKIEQGTTNLAIGEQTEIASVGEATTIEGIKNEGNDTIVVTSEGEVKASEMKFSQSDAELVAYAEGLSEEKANLFISQYDGKTKVSDYATSFELAYTYGETGFGADNVLAHKGVLSEVQASEIYKGAMYNKAKALQINVDAINAKHSGATSFVEGAFKDDIINYGEEDVEGKVKWSKLSTTQKGAIKFMSAFAKKAGVNITLVASKVVDGKHVGKNGSYNPKTNTIEIDVYAGRIDASVATDAIIPALSHELTHWMKAKSPAMYRAMQEIAMNNLGSRYNVDGYVKAEKTRLDKEHGEGHTDEDAIDEIVARTCEDMLANSKTARELLSKLSADEQKTFVDKAKEYVNSLIEWVDELMGAYSSGSEEAKMLREYRKAFREMSDAWDKALEDAIKANQNLQKEGITGEELSGNGEIQWADRVSDEFSLDATIEQTDGLIAVHNLSEEKLLKTIKLGAFPMPSIAITKASIGHKGFGSISLMFRKDTIDPRVFSSNKVYSGDAWTPTYPTVSYKVNEKVEDRASDKYYELAKRFGYDEVRPLYRYAENLEDTLNQDGGEKAMLERMYEDTSIMQIYLQDVGKGKVAPIEVETRTEMSQEEIEANRSFAEAIGSDILAEFETPSGENPVSHRKEYLEKYKTEIENAYRKVLVEHYGLTEEEAQSELNATKPVKMATILRNALQYTKTNGVTVRVEVDREATNNAIREASADGYKAWIDSLFKGAEEKTGIRNERDTFTPSGNRRSWDTLHYEETLENVIKAMKAQGEKGIGIFGGSSNIFGASANNFDSIGEIREAGKRLRNVSQEEFGEMKDSFMERFRSMADSLRAHEGWQALDSASELLVEAVSKYKTRDGIAGYIKREGKGWTNYSDSIVDDLIALVNDIRKMPVNYFEAKPLRAVGFDEVACAIVPNNISENVMAELSRLNIPTKEYEAGNEDARVEALASVEGVQFSDRGTWSSKDIENYHAFGEQINSLLSHEFDESNNLLVLNKTPDLLQKIGLDDKKILMTVKHFRNIVHPKGKNPHWHGLSYAQVKEAPIILEHPAIVVDSMTQSNAVVVISDLLDNDGNPIIISIATDGEGTHEYQMIPSNFLTSMYGREKFNNFITNLLNQNKMLYIDNKKSHDLYKNLGLQLPSAFTQIGFDKIIQQSKNIVKVQNSDRDSQGSVLTEEQQKYFANSQVRDANGNLKVMYHGSGASFTVFDRKKAKSSGYYGSGFYFTESESHASQYGSNYKVYLNITNPLREGTSNITKAQLKKFVQAVADNEDYGIENYGYGATVDSVVDSVWGKDDFGMIMDINATCVGDMVEATLLFNEVNGSDYDGIFVPTETVAFYPNQIKNTDNTAPTTDADIRYSDRATSSVHDMLGEGERLKKENAKLSEDIARLKERLALEKKITNGNTFNENQLKAVAKYLIKSANTEYDEKALIDDLREVYSYIATTPNLDWEDLMVRAYDVANSMMRKQKPSKMVNDYFKQVLKDIRQTRISLSPDQIAEAKSAFGEQYRNAFFGRVILVNEGTSLDRQWQEWASKYPEIFDAEVSVADQITELSSILDSLRDGAEMYQTYNDVEATRELAVEIYNQYWNVSTIRTTADKYDKQIKRLNFEHRKSMDEMRKDYKQRVADQRLADSIYYGKIIKGIRDKRDAKVKEARDLGRKRVSDYRDRVAKNAKIQKIKKTAKTLEEYLMKNSKEKHINEDLKPMVRSLIKAIDYDTSAREVKGLAKDGLILSPTEMENSLINQSAENMAKMKAEQSLLDSLYKVQKAFDSVEFFGMGIEGEIDKLVSDLETLKENSQYPLMVLNAMSLEQLETIDKLVSAVKSVVMNANKLHTKKRNLGVDGLGRQITEFLDGLGLGKVYKDSIGKYAKVFKWLNTVPHYAFKRLGDGGKTLFGLLQDGWDKLAFNVKQILDFANEAYTKEDVKKWSKEVKEFTLGGTTFKMTTPQIMSLQCLYKREQGRKHILGNGIRIGNFEVGVEVVNQPKNIKVTAEDVETIISTLSPEQRAVAEKLQGFMNTVCTEWGNYVSMERFGYKAFGEDNYFPIEVDENNISKDKIKDNKNVSLYALLNMGFTKSINENSKNALVVNDIFDVFANHASEMAKYNALGLAVLDFNRVMNYSEMREDSPYSIRTAMETAYGKDAEMYFNKLIADLNGTQNVSRDVIGRGFMAKAKLGAIGWNIKTVLLQPTAYLKASAIIDKRYLVSSVVTEPHLVKRGIERSKKYCGITLWKSLGFYDTNISRGVVEQIKHEGNLMDDWAEKSTKWMEKADELTFGALWNACELEVKSKQKDLKDGSEEFFQAVAERLREVVYATQVVDSTLTRSEMMRSGDTMDKMLTAFGSEPILAYNMLLDTVVQTDILKRSGASKETLQENRRRVARVVDAYIATNLVTAILETIMASFRDDEEPDEEEVIAMFWANFASNAGIIGKIPYLKDIVGIFRGYSPSRLDTQGIQSLYYALNSAKKNLQGEGSVSTTLKHSLKAYSSLSGLAFYNGYRDVMALLNKLDILTPEELEEMLEDLF